MKTLSSFDGLVDSEGDYAWLFGYYVMSIMSKIIFLASPLVIPNIPTTPKLNVVFVNELFFN